MSYSFLIHIKVLITYLLFIQYVDTEIRRYNHGEITGRDLALNVAKTTAMAFLRGGTVAGTFAAVQLGSQAMAASSNTVARLVGGFASKALGPGLMVAGLGYQAYHMLKAYNSGSMTTAEMQRQFIRLTGVTGETDFMNVFFFN